SADVPDSGGWAATVGCPLSAIRRHSPNKQRRYYRLPVPITSTASFTQGNSILAFSAHQRVREFLKGMAAQKSNNRHHRQDKNWLQDAHHHGVVVVHPICRTPERARPTPRPFGAPFTNSIGAYRIAPWTKLP